MPVRTRRLAYTTCDGDGVLRAVYYVPSGRTALVHQITVWSDGDDANGYYAVGLSYGSSIIVPYHAASSLDARALVNISGWWSLYPEETLSVVNASGSAIGVALHGVLLDGAPS